MNKRLITVGLLAALVAMPMASWAEGGADTFKAKCVMCHGADGKGKMAGTKDLGSAEVQKQSDADLTAVITKGKAPKMPAFDGKLTADQIKAVVAYIRTLKK